MHTFSFLKFYMLKWNIFNSAKHLSARTLTLIGFAESEQDRDAENALMQFKNK